MASKTNNEPQLPKFKVNMFSTKTLGESKVQSAIMKDIGNPPSVKISKHLPKK